MLYKKNASETLDIKLFQSPTSEYRGTPFWAWNDKLTAEELTTQIDGLREMGFGGFHMHTRSGMATPYLSDEFMDLIKACNEKAKENGMLAWLYDEDRWPSGSAGGIVTKDPAMRGKYLLFTVKPVCDPADSTTWSAYVGRTCDGVPSPVVDAGTGYLDGKPYLLCAFDIVLNPDGTLGEYRPVRPGDPTRGKLWYVYVMTNPISGWYNNQAYVDTLSDEAMRRFIEVTYDAYNEAVGADFDGSVPAIFTDEPQFTHMGTLPFARSETNVSLPWTTDLPDTFYEKYGFDLVSRLPELLWDLPAGTPSRARYLYHDHVCDRFTHAFAKQCGDWCREHGLSLTGHMLEEPTLHSQSATVGETMRAYGFMGLPGIDMLCDSVELSTAKQCQSAVHQYGKEGMTSELYGVTGWDFDFRGHKFQGDWQAALGVTVRVPHLAWVSMRGSAKRDYPASINYQSAWYKEYPYIEDHFARLNTALTRGRPVVRVGVLHPVESYWLAFGPQENTAEHRQQLESNFNNVINWLLRGTVDFDFISESILPDLVRPTDGATLGVGKMAYDAVVIPGVDTIRQSTLDILNAFIAKGGKVIMMGDAPAFVDARVPEDTGSLEALTAGSLRISQSRIALLDALKDNRTVEIRSMSGALTDSLIYNMREDTDCLWLFVTHVSRIYEFSPDRVRMTVYGRYKPTLYDTLTGKTEPLAYTLTDDGRTVMDAVLYTTDTVLIRLTPADASDTGRPGAPYGSFAPAGHKLRGVIEFYDRVKVSRSEPNVCVLDMAEWSEDGDDWNAREEILRIDSAMRRKYGFPTADGHDVQPWCIPEETVTHYPYLRFRIKSEAKNPIPVSLACESLYEATLNGKTVDRTDTGYFTDRQIRTCRLPDLMPGDNTLIVRMPIGKRVSLENLFLLGEFSVRAVGTGAVIYDATDTLAFGDVTGQGLPFYGANLTYTLPFDVGADCDALIQATRYKGALITARLDGKDIGRICFSPYGIVCPDLAAGSHTLELTLHLTRVNCFNALHNCSPARWIGPGYWYSGDVDWAYEYQLKQNGILKAPRIQLFEKN